MSARRKPMSATKTKKAISKTRLLLAAMVAMALLLPATARAAAPGITGPVFNLTAQAAYISQPDGAMIYSWGYGCSSAPGGFAPAVISGATCSTMQVPGPTLIVTEGQTVTVNLINSLPNSAGNTSILFPGFQVTATLGVQGLLTREATRAAGTTAVRYTFLASSPGTHAYYSGTQSDLQVEMGLYGAIIVLPAAVPANCSTGLAASNLAAKSSWGETDFRLAKAAYDHVKSCYDREYLFQFSEIDPVIHSQAQVQVAARGVNCVATAPTCSLKVATEPYHPAYFLINGRSMPDDMDPNYALEYPHQPYNGNPHMHPGEQVLLRIIGQGRWQHPFHEHGNHVRILGRDGNLIVSQTDSASLAGPLLFTTTTTPGLAMDGIFYWTGKGLNWDPYGHNPASGDLLGKLGCDGLLNGYHSVRSEYFHEWSLVRRQPLSRSKCDYPRGRFHWHDSAFGHHSEFAHRRGWLCIYVALPQRARDYHQQRFPRRNADDDAG